LPAKLLNLLSELLYLEPDLLRPMGCSPKLLKLTLKLPLFPPKVCQKFASRGIYQSKHMILPRPR